MSNLIVMPLSDGSFPDEPSVRTHYAGRCLALNLDKIKVFQTFKFYLGPRKLFATVPEEAHMGDICNAVLRGDLIDVTDQPDNGIKLDSGEMSPIAVMDIEPRLPIQDKPETVISLLTKAAKLLISELRDWWSK